MYYDPSNIHSIGDVARQTRLTHHVIRAWERRHSAITPTRTASGHRLYSAEDIERLKLLKHLIDGGHTIGAIAQLPTDRLKELSLRTEAPPMPLKSSREKQAEIEEIVRDCLEGARRLNARMIDKCLNQALIRFSQPVLLNQVMVPLMYRIGQHWHEGTLRVVHEHLASNVIQTFLLNLIKSSRSVEGAARLLVATPSGQRHEVGALLAAATASRLGWKVIYLGADLPTEEIALAAHQTKARAVALSLTYPGDDLTLRLDLQRLAEALEGQCPLILGGAAADQYLGQITSPEALLAHSLASFEERLASLRLPKQVVHEI